MKKKSLIFLFLALFIGICQPIFGQATLNQRVKEAPLIVEGEVISSISKWNAERTAIYTVNTILVSRRIKGDCKNSIEVITLGGSLPTDFQLLPHYLSLNSKESGISFLENKAYGNIEREFENRYRAYMEEGGFVKYISENNHFIAFDKVNSKFYDKKDLFDLISSLIVNQESSKKIPCPLAILQKTDPIEVTFSFKNASIDGEFINFDVFASCNINGTAFGKAELFIDYSNGIFGENIVANNSIELNKGSVLKNGEYTVKTEDESSSSLKISIISDENSQHGSLNSQPTEFCQVKIKIKDFSQLAHISFDDFKMVGKASYYCNGAFSLFDKVKTSKQIKNIFNENSKPSTITYRIANINYNAESSQLKFNIRAKSTTKTLLSDAKIDLLLSPNAFFEYPLLDKKDKIEIASTIANKSSYSISANDNYQNRLIIYLSSETSVKENLIKLDENEIDILSITLDAKTCTTSHDIYLEQTTMQDESGHFTGNLPFPWEIYSSVEVENPDNFILCGCDKPVIDDKNPFTPTTIAAGMGEILTIKGQFFGIYDAAKCKVIFRNGDDGGFSDAVAEEGDIITWTDTKIEVIVPSVTNGQSLYNPACSGIIKVKNDCGISSSTQKLIIPYAIINRRTVVDKPATKVGLKKTDAQGITFKYSSNISSFLKPVFQSALNSWCKQTQIGFFVSNSTTTITAAAVDGTNSITKEALTNPAAQAAVVLSGTYLDVCSNVSIKGWVFKELDVKISPNAINVSTLDLEDFILHELGHAHTLHHSKKLDINFSNWADQFLMFFEMTDLHANKLNNSIKKEDLDGAKKSI